MTKPRRIEETQAEIYRLLEHHAPEERSRIFRSVLALFGDIDDSLENNPDVVEPFARNEILPKALDCLRWITPEGRVNFLEKATQ